MTKTSATELLMGTLHAKVAAVMVKALTNVERAQDEFETIMNSGDSEMIAAAIASMPDVSPAFLSAATKFLADNKITCQPEDDKNVGGLAEMLSAKRENSRRKSVGNVVPFAVGEL